MHEDVVYPWSEIDGRIRPENVRKFSLKPAHCDERGYPQRYSLRIRQDYATRFIGHFQNACNKAYELREGSRLQLKMVRKSQKWQHREFPENRLFDLRQQL